MPRDDRVEQILAAWYALKIADEPHKASALASFNHILDQHRGGTSLSRSDLLQALRPRFDDFYKTKLREEHQFRKRT